MATVNAREYFRVNLIIPLSAQLKIVGIGNNLIETKYVKTFVKDIGAGGLKFHSKLDFPLEINLLLEFSFKLFNKDLKVLGTIVRKSALANRIFEYGIKFSINENERDLLVSQLNLLNARLRKSDVLASCSFSTEDEIHSLYSE